MIGEDLFDFDDDLAQVAELAQGFLEHAQRKQSQAGLSARDRAALFRVMGQLESFMDECAGAEIDTPCFRLPAATHTQ